MQIPALFDVLDSGYFDAVLWVDADACFTSSRPLHAALPRGAMRATAPSCDVVFVTDPAPYTRYAALYIVLFKLLYTVPNSPRS